MEKHLVKGTWGLRGPCQTARSATSCKTPVGAWLWCTACVGRWGGYVLCMLEGRLKEAPALEAWPRDSTLFCK